MNAISYPLQSRVYGIYSGLYSIHPVGLSPSVWNTTQGGVTMGGGSIFYTGMYREKFFKNLFS